MLLEGSSPSFPAISAVRSLAQVRGPTSPSNRLRPVRRLPTGKPLLQHRGLPMPVRVTEKSRVLIELPMMMFLRLADGDGKMTAREMERFDELLSSREWCRSPLLQRSLANTEAEKAEVWKRYTAGEFRTTIDQVAASLDTVLGSIAPEERLDFEYDLLQLCRRIRKAARGGTVLFWGDDDEGEATFDALSELIKRPSARAA